MTDLSLQKRLVAKFPERIKQIHGAEIYEFDFMWAGERDRGIYDTEWLAIVAMVEENIKKASGGKSIKNNWRSYRLKLWVVCNPDSEWKNFNNQQWIKCISASWQQRATALCEIGAI